MSRARDRLPEDVADARKGLVSARYATGQVLLVDGGTAPALMAAPLT